MLNCLKMEKMTSPLLFILLPLVVSSLTMTIEELLASSYDLNKLTMVESFHRQSPECPHVMEEVIVFVYNMMDNEGIMVNETITVSKAQEVEVGMFHAKDNLENSGKL